MYSARIKRGVFWLEGINALATTYYFYFIFFFLKQQFTFGHLKNLLWAAALGAVFCVTAIVGGKVGQRWGYFKALGFGFAVLAGSLGLGTFVEGEMAHFLVMLVAAAGMCFTWPNLEAMAAEKESPARLQRNLGIYNLIWSGGNGVAFFTGGAMLEHWGPRSIFYVPVLMHLVQLIYLWRLTRLAAEESTTGPEAIPQEIHLSTARERKRSPVAPVAFMKMAWVANPFSYVAINTAVPLLPFLTTRLELNPTEAGVVCSLWFFARTAAFGLLWKWDGWHYRYRFLAWAYAGMVAGFAAIVLAQSLAMLIAAQLLFGGSLGLIYYSSLFYSMDVGETKGEHGGLHEGAIGLGIFAGPATAALATWLLPDRPNAGIMAVGLLLLVGFGVLTHLRWRK